MRVLLIFFAMAAFAAAQCSNSLRWSTSKGQMFVNDQQFVLKGVSYFGFETETHTPHGIWSYSLDWFLDFIKNNNFNAIRVPFSLQLVRDDPRDLNINCNANPGLCGKSALELMETFIDRAADRGLLIMLDNHRIDGGAISELWYNNEYPESTVIGLWKKLLARVSNKWNVFAIDLKNEPHDSASWGNSNPATDWNKAAERMIRELRDFPGLFFVEGVEWGNRLEAVRNFPINTGDGNLDNRVVYSPHCYGPSVYDRPEFNTPDFPHNLDSIYKQKYAYVADLTDQPVVVGEWGGRALAGTRDRTWNEWYVQFLRRNCLNSFYWCLNPNSGDTGGLLEDDWQTPIPYKLGLVQTAQPNPTKFSNRNGQICITKGQMAEEWCRRDGKSYAPAPPPPVDVPHAPPPLPPQSGGGNGGVSAEAVVTNKWVENGQEVYQYVIKLKNHGSKPACNIQIALNANIKQKWNMDDAGNGVVRAPEWLRIEPGQASEQAGMIVIGRANPQVKSAATC